MSTATYPTVPGSAIEIVRRPKRAPIRHALFDLDGTISLLRDGWQDHMVPHMVEVLAACPRAEPRDDIERLVIDFVDHLTGKQTIYQMIRLCEEVEKRGGTPLEPLEYKRQYNARLGAAIASRLEALERREADPERWLIPGARGLLESLVARGVRCYIASGTDEDLVQNDCRLLGITELFEGGIFGALPNYRDFSKEKVIRKLLADFELSGPELLVVGDGFVEIENAVAVEAIALGVHTRESNQYHMNADKRGRLLRAGAHFLATDLSEAHLLLDWLEV